MLVQPQGMLECTFSLPILLPLPPIPLLPDCRSQQLISRNATWQTCLATHGILI